MASGDGKRILMTAEWSRFANGQPYPYICWGSPFRQPSEELISEHGRSGISVIATGQKDKGEIALLSFGIKRPADEITGIIGGMATMLRRNGDGPAPPEWKAKFEKPFEDLQAHARHEDSGLIVISHGNNGDGSEAVAFGNVASAESIPADLELITGALLKQNELEASVPAPGALPATPPQVQAA